ncbi:MAG: ThuA domain-containing protein [Gemmataceae bacterium]|nr:ThuA domain-containing protein [Gemmataceae bacterium]
MNRLLAVFALALGACLMQNPATAQEKYLDQINKALPEKAPAEAKAKRKVLVYSKTAGFRHSSIPVGVRAFTLMGDKTGAYIVEATEDPSYFAPEKLKSFDAVIMLNTTGDCLRPAADKNDKDAQAKARDLEELYKKSLHQFVLSGKGLMGTHSATDTYGGWKAYNKMMGGTFNGHPWTQKVPVKNLAPSHPFNAAFEGKDFNIDDEIYQFRADGGLESERLILLALDTKTMDVSKGNRKDGTYPVSWCATYGKGRTFYCSLGHREQIYFNPQILKHYLAGLQYVLGDLEAPSKATEDTAYQNEKK